MSRKPRTDDVLRETSKHLHYEYGMLTEVIKRLRLGTYGQDVILHYALLESFVIHLRNLIDFLYSERPQPDDVIAEDFFSSPDRWHKMRPRKSDTLNKAKKRANKEAAHLTYARLKVSLKEKPWKYALKDEIEAVFDIFLEGVPEHLLDPIWNNVIRTISDD